MVIIRLKYLSSTVSYRTIDKSIGLTVGTDYFIRVGYLY